MLSKGEKTPWNTRENLNHVTGGDWGERATDPKRGKNDTHWFWFLHVIGQQDNSFILTGHNKFLLDQSSKSENRMVVLKLVLSRKLLNSL